MDSKTILSKNKNIITRKIEDETILVPLYKTSEEINCIYTLNECSAFVWDLIDGKKTIGKIKKIILDEFDVTEKSLDKELEGLLGDLKEIEAVR